MKFNHLFLVAGALVLAGGGSFAAAQHVLADAPTLMAQTTTPKADGPRHGHLKQLVGLTDAQQAQLEQIHQATRDRIEAIFTPEQQAQMTTIRESARTQVEAILTEEQRQEFQAEVGESGRPGPGRGKISNLTEAQRTQLRQIHDATHEQMDAVITAEQQAQIDTIRQQAKAQADAVLTAEQRQQLEQLRQERQQNRQQS